MGEVWGVLKDVSKQGTKKEEEERYKIIVIIVIVNMWEWKKMWVWKEKMTRGGFYWEKMKNIIDK